MVGLRTRWCASILLDYHPPFRRHRHRCHSPKAVVTRKPAAAAAHPRAGGVAHIRRRATHKQRQPRRLPFENMFKRTASTLVYEKTKRCRT